jgi:SAM-dependent methyltransferase
MNLLSIARNVGARLRPRPDARAIADGPEKIRKLLADPHYIPFDVLLRSGKVIPVPAPGRMKIERDGSLEIFGENWERNAVGLEEVASIRTKLFGGVNQEIAPDDQMFEGYLRQYFRIGRSALDCISAAMVSAGMASGSVRRILDFPSGHGRALRYLKAEFPQAELTACDVDPSAVAFCERTFGALGVESSPKVSEIALDGDYDLIWSGSLLTHLRAGSCVEFIRLFTSLAAPGGLIIFTMHGASVREKLAAGTQTYPGLPMAAVPKLIREFDAAGFAYADYAGAAGYGISLAHPTYVLSHLCTSPFLKLVMYEESGWDNHQDVICLQKTVDLPVATARPATAAEVS